MSKSEFIREFGDVLTTREMADQLNCTKDYVRKVRRTMNDASVAKHAERMRHKVRRDALRDNHRQ